MNAAVPGTVVVRRRVVVEVEVDCADGSAGCASALLRAASQARQRSASLDVVSVLPPDATEEETTTARVRLGKFTRRVMPHGAGAPVRLKVVRGDPATAFLLAGAGAELLIRHRPGDDPDGEPLHAAHPRYWAAHSRLVGEPGAAAAADRPRRGRESRGA